MKIHTVIYSLRPVGIYVVFGLSEKTRPNSKTEMTH